MSGIEQRQAMICEKLRRELGEDVIAALGNPDVIEVMVNPDGRLWVDTLSQGMINTGAVLSEPRRDMVLRTMASYYDRVITAEAPRIQAELPLGGERFQGMRPSVVREPSFVIRKHVPRVFSLLQLLEQGTITPEQMGILVDALHTEKNMVIAGPTMSGKTVVLDSLLREWPLIHGANLRVIVIEDTLELHVEVENKVTMRATETDSMRVLVQTAMRLRPDRLVIGEVRGAEALEMMKSWATGHAGSACTVHAKSPGSALWRLKLAAEESGTKADQAFIGEVVDLVIMMKRRASNKWAVEEIVACEGWNNGAYMLTRLDTPRKETAYGNGVTPH